MDTNTQTILSHLQNHSDQFSWLETPIPQTNLVAPGEEFLALVIGGSMIRWSITSHTENGIQFEHIHEREVSEWESIRTFATYLTQIIPNNISVIAFNLALPLEPMMRDSKVDGVLLRATKSQLFLDCIGHPVGATLEALLKESLKRDFRITVANDTSCLLLAAKSQHIPEAQLAGLIVGSGINMSFQTETHLVNLEAGNFDDFSVPDTTRIIDAESFNPSEQLFEKTVAGHYLYHHYNLRYGGSLTKTRELSHLAAGTSPESVDAKALLRDSATMVAQQLAALAHFLNTQSLQVIAEGSLFWHGYHYKEYLEEAFLIETNSQVKLSWISIPHSSLTGAAMLVK